MRLLTIRVRNFRCIADETLLFDDLTALVGANGAGKSAFLRALNYFYEGPISITLEDFYNRDASRPIEIRVTYGDFTTEERGALDRYVHDDVVQVLLRITFGMQEDGSQGTLTSSYHGWTASHDAFQQIRALGGASAKLKALKELVASNRELYDFTPDTSAWGRAESQMTDWEDAHKDHCSVEEDAGGYFRGPNTGAGPLAQRTELIFVPAVRDASDEATASRSNAIGRVVGLVVGDVSTSSDVQGLSQDFREKYAAVVEKEESERLPALQQQLTEALRGYVPYASVKLEWRGADVSLISPQTVVKLEDDGFLGEIEGKGHGLQRLFIVSILQVAAAVRAASMKAEASEAAGTSEAERAPVAYVLAIEEPELYQHPIQARRFATVLSKLSRPDGESAQIQVVYSTHSPLFVGMDRFDSIRVARKVSAGADLPLVTQVHSTTLSNVMTTVNEAFGRVEYSLDRFRSALGCILTTSVSEGFFAHAVVLVEGQEDQAVVEAALRAGNAGLEEAGVAVIPADGKGNLDRAYAIFTGLGIACYVVFDADAHRGEDHGRPEVNLALQRLCGEAQPAEFPETAVHERYTVFHRELSKDIPEEFGAKEFYETRDRIATEMGWKDELSRAQKNPVVLERVIRHMYERGHRTRTLDDMVTAIRALANAVRRTPSMGDAEKIQREIAEVNTKEAEGGSWG